jgi:hypothetical protein
MPDETIKPPWLHTVSRVLSAVTATTALLLAAILQDML